MAVKVQEQTSYEENAKCKVSNYTIGGSRVKTVGRAEHVGVDVALVDLMSLCTNLADFLASERATFKMT